ncbi:MAG: peptidylprolyl isomerase [Nocardioidaceae bacterium]
MAEGATWVATVTTNCGDIELELDGAKAPQTVASFLQLSTDSFYDDTPCHRLTTDGIFVLQCGDPTGSGSGGPGYGYGIENAPKDGAYPTGTLAMARSSDPNSNGSQFFIVYQDTMLPVEGGGYTIFGKVTKGLDIVQSIADKGVDGGSRRRRSQPAHQHPQRVGREGVGVAVRVPARTLAVGGAVRHERHLALRGASAVRGHRAARAARQACARLCQRGG